MSMFDFVKEVKYIAIYSGWVRQSSHSVWTVELLRLTLEFCESFLYNVYVWLEGRGCLVGSSSLGSLINIEAMTKFKSNIDRNMIKKDQRSNINENKNTILTQYIAI